MVLVHAVTTSICSDGLVADYDDHRKVFVRVTLSRSVVFFGGEMQYMDDALM